MTLFLAQFSIGRSPGTAQADDVWDGVRNYQVGGKAGP